MLVYQRVDDPFGMDWNQEVPGRGVRANTVQSFQFRDLQPHRPTKITWLTSSEQWKSIICMSCNRTYVSYIYIHNKSIWSKLHIHAVQNRHVYLSTVWISIGPADEQKDQVMSLYSRRSACLGVRRLREQIAAASSPIFFGKAKRNGKNDIQLGQYSWVVDLLKIFGLIGSSDAWSRGFCWWFEQEVLGDCHDVGILNCDNTHTHENKKNTLHGLDHTHNNSSTTTPTAVFMDLGTWRVFQNSIVVRYSHVRRLFSPLFFVWNCL